MRSWRKANLRAPWIGIAGFIVLAVMLSLLIFIGEAVCDAEVCGKTEKVDESLLVGPNKGIQNVVVSITDEMAKK